MIAKAKAEGIEIPPDAEMDLPSIFRGFLDFVSPANEIAAWQLIARAADKRLAEYETSMEQDVAIIVEIKQKGLEFPPAQENCIMLRLDDKTLLEFLKETAARVEALLGMTQGKA